MKSQLLFGHLPGADRTHTLENGNQVDFLATGKPPDEHGPAAHDDGRNIETCSRHQHARYDFVAVWNQHQCVKCMGNGHHLYGVCDQLAAAQHVFHPHVVHGDTVTDTDGSEFNRRSAGHIDTCFYRFYDFIQVRVPRNDLVGRVGNTDQRTFDFRIRVADGFKQRSVRRSFHSFFYGVTSHGLHLPLHRICSESDFGQKKIRYRFGADNGFFGFYAA